MHGILNHAILAATKQALIDSHRKAVMKQSAAWMIALFILFIPAFSFAETKTQISAPQSSLQDINCMQCHSDKVNEAKFAASVHGANRCAGCHSGISDVNTHANGLQMPAKTDCSKCHPREAKEYESSAHKVDQKFDCTACHSPIHELMKWDGKKASVIRVCSACHSEEDFVRQGHGAAVLKGNEDSAACSDCHGMHDTPRFHINKDQYPIDARLYYTNVCLGCHNNKEMMARNHRTTKSVETYLQNYHGKIYRLGSPTYVAGCADCHSTHDILPATDPKSGLHPDNLVKNCLRCHKNANANLVKYHSHADYKDRSKYPIEFWTMAVMTVYILFGLITTWSHTLLWSIRSYIAHYRLKAQGHVVDPEILKIKNPGEYYRRFSVPQQIMHLLLMISFFGLVLTGMPLKFCMCSWQWGLKIMNLLGGAKYAGLLHRIFAVVLISLVLIGLVISARFAFSRKKGTSFLDRLTGPDSLFFRKKDWNDLKCMLKWFFGFGQKPKFDRWTYYEKAEFLSLMWGMFVIGVTGLFLWFNELAAKVLPGWIFNVSTIIHSYEALLAACVIFTVHFFNVHFIPGRFPMDPAMFTGRIEKYKLVEERSLYMERLEKEGKLDLYRAKPPGLLLTFFSGAFGIASLILGIGMMVLIVIGFLG